MLLGVHCSISGGVHNACKEAAGLETDTFQIFTKNQRQWKEKQFEQEEIDKFTETFEKGGIKVAFSHCSYLINLANTKPEGRKKSVKALIGEVQRCDDLGLPYTVLHPGFPKDQSEEKGIDLIVEGLKTVLSETSDATTKILVENMAGQGSAIGGPFEHLRNILEKVGSDRIGTCFDTCHAFAAGYDLRTQAGVEDTFETWDKIIGLDHLDTLHLNDSKEPFDSQKDRHEHIGQGEIGETPFKYIMQHFPDTPKVLETPKEKGMDKENLDKLRAFAQ